MFEGKAFLYALPFAFIVPLLIHLLIKKRKKVVYFPPVKLLTEKTHRKRVLEDVLQLVLRMLLALCLVFLFARPYLTAFGRKGLSGTAVIFDASPSMEGCDLGAITKMFSNALALTSKGSGSAVYLCAQMPVEVYRKSDFQIFNVKESPEECFSTLSHYENLIFITDMRGKAWKEFVSRKDKVASPHKVVFVNPPNCIEKNYWIEELKLMSSSGTQKINVRVMSTVHEGPSYVDMFLGDKKLRRIHLKGESAIVPLNFKTGSSKFLKFRIEGRDGVPMDNERYLTLSNSVGGEGRILVFDGEPSEISYMDEAYYLINFLKSSEELWRKTELYMDISSLIKAAKPGDTIIILNPDSAEISTLKIEKLVTEGSTVVLAPGDRTPEGLKFSSFVLGRKMTFVEPEGISFTRYGEMEFQPSSHLREILSKVKVKKSFEVFPSEGNLKVIFEFSGEGSPALLKAEAGSGKLWIFAFPLDSAWSDFPIKPAFVPVMYEIITERGGESFLVLSRKRPGVYSGKGGEFALNPVLSDSHLEKVRVKDVAGVLGAQSVEVSASLEKAVSGVNSQKKEKRYIDLPLILLFISMSFLEFILSGVKV